MKKLTIIPVAMILCYSLIMTGDTLQSGYTNGNITYSITKTMAAETAETDQEDNDSGSEPYFSKQWALYNDGTFSLNTNAPDGTEFNNGGFYNRGGFSMKNPYKVPGKNEFKGNSGKYTENIFPNTDIIKYSNGSSGTQYNALASAVAGIDLAVEKAWETVGDEGREVLVAIIDTGVDYTHEDLSDAIWTNEGETAGDGIDNDGNGYIDDVYGWDFYNNKAYVYNSRNASEYDHGTHCAGTIAAAINNTGIAGIASNGNVRIMTIKALGGKDGSGDTASITKAIKYAESMGADICNLSFGTTSYDEEMGTAIENSDMLFVCAAGNGDSSGAGVNTDDTPLYPAAFDFDNIVSVANLKYDGTLDASSNYGISSVDIAAPGTYILSTTAGNGYEYLSGSSMSAPMVTAVLAMTYSYFEDISVLDAKDIILSTAEPLDSLESKVAAEGMVNAYNAVTADIDSILDE